LGLGLGVAFFTHGAQKMLGWWGGRQKGQGFEYHVLVLAMTAARR